ncbi:RimJ/RimL family protein N-acetyltransferase, partial [Dietzia sp. DQ12-76]|nr:RimJ/RimL family protein N-acetyltransferase [Dietzia sp. DQ12-76]
MWNVVATDATAHPGWPLEAGPLRVRAGVVTLRPVRRRDA